MAPHCDHISLIMPIPGYDWKYNTRHIEIVSNLTYGPQSKSNCVNLKLFLMQNRWLKFEYVKFSFFNELLPHPI